MKEIGTLGEKLVGRWLELQNYNLIQQNWRCRWGEIDIIAQNKDSKAIAFVEVKTRSKRNWDENGLLGVDFTKQEKIIKTASLFLAKYPNLAELPCRFDVALVSYEKLLASEGNDINIDIKKITQLTIGKPVVTQQYQFTIKDYLKSAFDNS